MFITVNIPDKYESIFGSMTEEEISSFICSLIDSNEQNSSYSKLLSMLYNIDTSIKSVNARLDMQSASIDEVCKRVNALQFSNRKINQKVELLDIPEEEEQIVIDNLEVGNPQIAVEDIHMSLLDELM